MEIILPVYVNFEETEHSECDVSGLRSFAADAFKYEARSGDT